MEIRDDSQEVLRTDSISYLRITREGERTDGEDEILHETMMSVLIDNELALKMVCTPVDLPYLILGHLYSEGKIDSMDDISSIFVCNRGEAAIVETDHGYEKSGSAVEIRSCDCGTDGFLGRELLDRKNSRVYSPVPDFDWKPDWIFEMADAFQELTPIYRMTRGIHSALLFYDGKIRYTCEDIGRHNAFDKVIGHALADGLDLSRAIVYSSGRIPEDMISKAIRCRIPVLAGKAVPTARAVELARKYHVTLICSARPDGMKVFACSSMWKNEGGNE